MNHRAQVAESNTLPPGTILDNRNADANEGRDLFNSLSGKVELLDVVHVQLDSFHGKVYNLQTQSGWYLANGIITHNCAHRVLPYIWTQKTKEEQEDALRQAKKPFNLDPRGEAERMRYEKAQRENAERLRDRKQWERYKAVLGDDAPKTFSGFRAMKRAGSENFRFMSLDYKRQSRLAANPALALPNAGKATAADAKFTSYIFSPSNPDGLAKGVAFTNRLGYDSDNWEELRDKILKAAPRYPTRLRGEDENGASFEQKIILWGLKGKPANVIVGWKTKDSLTWMTTAYISEVKFDVDD